MSTSIGPRAARPALRHELEALRGEWAWFLALGIVLIVLGTIAIGMPLLTSLATALMLGVLMILAGIVQSVGAFWSRDWSGFFLHLMSGVLYLVLGLLFLRAPVEALLALTLLLACFLLVGGLFRIIGALMYRFPHWGWVLVSGILNVVLGVLIWQQWPASALWVIGLFMGIEMIFNGWTWVMLAMALRSLPRLAPAP